MVAHWNRVALGRRVINIYDGPNSDTYIFKLDKRSSTNDKTSGANKANNSNDKDYVDKDSSNLLLLLESGVRFHTSAQSSNPGMPSQFCAKLRKHIRGLRLEQVTQLGTMDRVVHLVFGSGDAQRHSLMLELYARGNIVLTDNNYTILSLLRSHEYSNVIKKVEENEDAVDSNIDQDKKNDNGNNGSTSNGNKEIIQVKMLLMKSSSGVSHYGPSLIEHCLRCANLWGGETISVDKIATNKYPRDLTTSEEWKVLQSVLQSEGKRILNNIQNDTSKGYVLYQAKNNPKQPSSLDNESPFDDKILLEFQPHLLKQHESMPRLEYSTFDLAVDTFFSHLDLQKRVLRAEQQELQAEQRLEKIRLDQEKRFESLIDQQESLQEEAQLVEIHADMVEKALQVVNSALDSGMDWEQLEDLVDLEARQNHNPVAMLIHQLDLEHDEMVLRLVRVDALYSEDEDDGDDDEKGKSRFQNVRVSLNETAHGNAKALFAKYRASKEKSKKTMEQNAKALDAAEENAKRQMLEAQKNKSHISLKTKRKALWFEKFNWFITTDNYLVLGGRDAQQNEQLVKRYLRAGDAYLHADVHGAASCILRAKRERNLKTGKTSPIPLSSQALREAGNFTICRSSAWSSRMVTSSWWVESHQVSKTAPTGEYLTVGSFMIRGKKNFLPPTQLEMGLAVLFRLGDEDSFLRHKDERRDFALIQQEEEKEEPLNNDIEAVSLKKPEKNLETIQVHDRETEISIQDVNSDEIMTNTDQESLPKKKGLSAKDRRQIKKYGTLEAARAAEEERNIIQQEQDLISQRSSVIVQEAPTKQTNHKRGKKAKLKRMAKKYADQDEEDRELALIALHAGEKSKKTEKKKAPQIKSDGYDGKRKNKAEKTAEQESWKNTLSEEGIIEGNNEEEDAVDDTAELDKLTGKPLGEDLILFAVPVCAPYQSLSKYAYRVKLTPGNMKRGKASKQCIDMFLRESAVPEHCRGLIKNVADNEWVQAICGDVKISAAGASKAIQKSKAKSKASKRNKNKK
ncbi:DUF814-domain-containing protein [Fragilariopsis cylindrus CCMP1102]|uniref:DUF814-domain-containing protein n=1 Tax=Fragilariopsis cylindrus CCMP1102 TaxID=635003 RepID=A0A1E7FRS9_9STRA|nr:DUF814-domain-containing protein [Fragilariopsis cylindrus CCMP1102]|eukprot:OEU20848.1 DUF814-domain-containing protein [Fragilariopsis cylindrus CCMP1102]